ncbi:MAG: aspartate-semialdehyde dehydrogenase, partial [Phycisphaerales bacterium]
PIAASGSLVVDNSSAYRHDPEVPLVVPEVNLAAIRPSHRLIANPNCSTILLVMAVSPLRRAFGVSRIDVCTYQAVSGAGAGGIHELRDGAHAALHGRDHTPRVFKEPCAFNVFSHNSHVDPHTGLNGEETKIIRETQRIFDDDTLEVCPTCVRVPVFRAHAEAVTLTLRRDISEVDLRAALQHAPGVRIIDDREGNSFPTSLKASGGDDVLVGRLRLDPGASPGDRSRRACLFLAGDQLRKGAALNAIQIADHLVASKAF